MTFSTKVSGISKQMASSSLSSKDQNSTCQDGDLSKKKCLLSSDSCQTQVLIPWTQTKNYLWCTALSACARLRSTTGLQSSGQAYTMLTVLGRHTRDRVHQWLRSLDERFFSYWNSGAPSQMVQIIAKKRGCTAEQGCYFFSILFKKVLCNSHSLTLI